MSSKTPAATPKVSKAGPASKAPTAANLAASQAKQDFSKATVISATKFSSMRLKLGSDYRSRDYITNAVFFGGALKVVIDDVLVQLMTAKRNENYGTDFVTLGLPIGMVDMLESDTKAAISRTVYGATHVWFSATFADKFQGIQATDSKGSVEVDLSTIALEDVECLTTRVLLSAYVSRSADGGVRALRFKLHHMQIMDTSKVEVPDLDSLNSKTAAALPTPDVKTAKILMAAFREQAEEDSDEDSDDEETFELPTGESSPKGSAPEVEGLSQKLSKSKLGE